VKSDLFSGRHPGSEAAARTRRRFKGRPASTVRLTTVALALSFLHCAPAQAAALRAIRFITEPAATRLIVEFSAPVQHRLQQVAARPDLGVPARLYVDLFDARLADGLRVPGEFSEGPLQRLRATQDAETTRLILDVPGLAAFDTFAIPDPFRLIIDVRGTARAAVARPVAPHVSAAMAPTPARVASPAPALAAVGPVGSRRAPTPAAPRYFKIVLDPGHGGKDPGAFGVGGVARHRCLPATRRAHRARQCRACGSVRLDSCEREPEPELVRCRDVLPQQHQ
jgi:N-acetylmuramoyl-L-alanine amidase